MSGMGDDIVRAPGSFSSLSEWDKMVFVGQQNREIRARRAAAQVIEEPRIEPGDHLEEALFAWKPGSQTAEQIAEHACRLAGLMPPFPNQLISDLATVAQDLIDHDPRTEEGES